MEQELDNELKWSVCRVFNKPTYYAVKRHLDRTEEKPRFTELKTKDFYEMFWKVCWPMNFHPEQDFVVLKVDDIEMTPTTQGRNIPGLLLKTKVLKTEDTRHIEATLRTRDVRATGSLAALLGNTLKIADVLVICKNYLVPTANFSSYQWSKVKQRAVMLNDKKRPHTMIFMYRHDGQFNYSWNQEVRELAKERNWRLYVRMTLGVEHGACVLIQPEVERAETPLLKMPITASNAVTSVGNVSDENQVNWNFQESFFESAENFERFFAPSQSFETSTPRTTLMNRQSPVAEQKQSPQPGSGSMEQPSIVVDNVDGLPVGPCAGTKRMRDSEKREAFGGARVVEQNAVSEDVVSQASKRVRTEWSTQTFEFGSQDDD